MSKFLDTRGEQVLSPYICDRCKLRGKHSEMMVDPDKQGLFVHKHCADELDPWKLPPRQSENVSVDNPRPDTPTASAGENIVPNEGKYNGLVGP